MQGGEENTRVRPPQDEAGAEQSASRYDLASIQITSSPADLSSSPVLTDHIEFSSLAHTVEEYKLGGKLALTKILEQLSTYLQVRVASDELELFCLSLQHLFSDLDTLYCHALISLNDSTYAAHSISESSYDLFSRQHIWTQLQVIRRVLRSLEPLCKLLATITATLLGDLENSAPFSDASIEFWEVQGKQADELPWAQLPEEDWEQTVVALCESVGCWQQCLANQPPFATQFSRTIVSPQLLGRLDSLFKSLLECGGALFGDILPGFHLVIWHGDTELAAHLLDLAQQVDQMLFLSQKLRDPLLALLDCFSAVN